MSHPGPTIEQFVDAMQGSDAIDGAEIDYSRCPYCAEGIQEVDTVSRWQPIYLEPDGAGGLEIVEYDAWETSDHGTGDVHYFECRAASHSFETLDDLAAEQREQFAIEHAAALDECSRMEAIYQHPMFAGQRARLARGERERSRGWRYEYQSRERWTRFLALDGAAA